MSTCDDLAPQLLEKIKEWNAQALNKLRDCYFRMGVNLLKKEKCLEMEAQDICAAFFEKLWIKFTRENGWKIEDFKSYFSTSIIRQWAKKQKKEQHVSFDDFLLLKEDLFYENDTEQEHLLKLMERGLEILKNKNPKCWELLDRFYRGDQSMKEIAEAMGYSSENVARTTKNRCMDYLKEIIKNLDQK
ncbi:MAG: sigma-70 family RNA polymerase sigma factor [Bacteroidia bacterium]|nr:sigma-70 family RNA polymerase sigma factor [Bacteroidia bacterium]